MKNLSHKIRFSFIKIITGSDLFTKRIPFMVIDSDTPGPRVWLTACGHGDEVGGIVVIHEIFKKLRSNPLIKGSISAFPLMNPLGFEMSSRNITLTKEDLNRSFPGNPNGSLAQRIAHRIFTTIVQNRPSVVLDLHNDWIKSIPYILIETRKNVKNNLVYEKIRDISGRTGFLVVCDHEEIESTLSFCLLQNDIPAITFELGESFIVNEKNIKYGVGSIWNVLSYLEMVKPGDEPFEYNVPEECTRKILAYSDRPLSSSSGIIRFLVRPGDIVNAGRPIARVYNAFGKLQETISAVNRGIVLGHTDSSVAFPGIPIMAFGLY